MRLLRPMLTRVKKRLGPRAQRLLERVLAQAGFPTNASGNNVSGR